MRLCAGDRPKKAAVRIKRLDRLFTHPMYPALPRRSASEGEEKDHE
jgi:hypothetical protein